MQEQNKFFLFSLSDFAQTVGDDVLDVPLFLPPLYSIYFQFSIKIIRQISHIEKVAVKKLPQENKIFKTMTENRQVQTDKEWVNSTRG